MINAPIYNFPPVGDIEKLAGYGLKVTTQREWVHNPNGGRGQTAQTITASLGSLRIVYLPESDRYRYTGGLWRQLAKQFTDLFAKQYTNTGPRADFGLKRFLRDVEQMRVLSDPTQRHAPLNFGNALHLYGAHRNLLDNTLPDQITGGWEVPIMSLNECYDIAAFAGDLTKEQWAGVCAAWQYKLPVDVLWEISQGASIELMREFQRPS